MPFLFMSSLMANGVSTKCSFSTDTIDWPSELHYEKERWWPVKNKPMKNEREWRRDQTRARSDSFVWSWCRHYSLSFIGFCSSWRPSCTVILIVSSWPLNFSFIGSFIKRKRNERAKEWKKRLGQENWGSWPYTIKRRQPDAVKWR